MTDQTDLMADVLGQAQPVTNDHPVAQETYEAVKAALEARAAGTGRETTPESGFEDEWLSADVDSGTVIRPGDTVIFSTRDRITREHVEHLKEQLAETLPGIIPIVLDGIHIEGVYRRDDDG